MIAFPPQKRPSIKEQFELFKAHMATVPDLTIEHLRGSGLVCLRCGMEMTVRRGRRTGRYMVFHPACDDMGGFAWWGATREEAIAGFQRFSEQPKGGEPECQYVPADFSTKHASENPTRTVPNTGDLAIGNAAPKVPSSGAATFQGMAFSVEGLSEEEVNSLLTMKEEG